MTSQNNATPDRLEPGEGLENSSQSNDTPSRKPASRSARWKDLERTAARKLGGVRIVRADFFEKSPDVRVNDFRLIVECKSRKRFGFHRHIEQGQSYCMPDEMAVLVTKEAGQRGEYATLPLNLLGSYMDEIRALQKAVNMAIQHADPELQKCLLREKSAIFRARDSRYRDE